VGSAVRRAGQLGALALAAAVFALLLVASPVFASKQVINYAGGSSGFGGKGGQFTEPRDVAVNTTGVGPADAGDFYVIEERNNRVQRLDQDGGFVSAWGSNVVTAPVGEVQKLTVSASAGTYKLSFDGTTTADIAFDAGAGAIGIALRELPTMGASGLFNVDVSGSGPFTISFFSSLEATDVPQITVDTSSLTGSATVETTTQGSGQFELCTVAANCREGTGSGAANLSDNAKNGSLTRPQSIALDGDSGNVYVADRDNRRVNEYTGDGTFIRSFGWGVDASTPGEGYEVCPAADRCTYGIAGSGVGQLGQNLYYTVGIAISPPDGNPATGTVFLADPENRRLDTFGLDGTSPSSIGSSAQFEENQPRKVAVDSRGIVYASDSKNQDEIERYDSENANGGGAGFLAPIAMPPLLEGPEGDATKGLAVDPDSDGAGPEEDVLYVLRGSWASGGVVQQFGPLNEPGLTSAPSAVDDTHGAEAGFETFGVLGLGFDETSGHIFVSAQGDVSGTGYAHRVYILGEAPAPAATLDPVTIHDAHSATFTGSVDANGALTGYRFEYVDDAEFGANGFTNATRVPISDVSVGHGEGAVPVEAKTSHHLIPGTLYHVRLVAKHTFYASQAVSSTQTFTTENAAPVIDGIDASVPGTEEATLLGAIERSSQEVSDYHFEWGIDTSYGNSTPAGSLLPGSEPAAVSEELSGLAPGQTYHYRLRATNATGTTTSPDRIFTTPAGPPQLPQRGFEIASQYPTGGVPIVEVTGRQTASEDGDSLATSAVNPLAHSTLPPLPDDPHDDSIGGALQNVLTRGVDSWQHRTEAGLGGPHWSGDLQRLLAVTRTQAPGSGFGYEDARVDPDDRNNTYDVYQWRPDGKLTWISRDPRIPAGTPQTTDGVARLANESGSFTMSADGRTVVIRSQRQLLDSDTTPRKGEPFDPFALYKWEDGQLDFIGHRPDGSVPAQGSYLGDRDGGVSARYAVSRDGSRVIFSALRRDVLPHDPTSPGVAIYVQTDGQPTVEATKEEGVAPLPDFQPYNVTYRGAAADDSRVFFTSASRLTPDSGASAADNSFHPGGTDLYAYDVAADKLRDLTPRLDGLEDPSVDPPIADRARVLGVAANSEDGKRVYFVAEGAYPTAPNPHGDLPQANAPNLYMAELDSIDEAVKLRFVATLGGEDGGNWQADWSGVNGPGNINHGKTALASADGSVLGFGSTQSLTGQPLGGTEQLFVFDAATGGLECASCPSNGTLPADTVNKYVRAGAFSVADWQGDAGVRRWVSSDGAVFFTSSTALLPADQNEVDDVYEFREGGLRLITTGQKGATDSVLSGASVDGGTVFLNTREALAPQDKEPGIPKIYAARVGGGYPFVPPPAPCDFNAGACEGAPSTVPETAGAGTAAFEGPGNVKRPSKRACPKGKRKVRAKGKTRCVNNKKRHHRNANNDRRASR
jgi:hypothetical protein